MKLYVATHNAHKIREMSQILPDFEIVADDPEGVEETAPDFIGNALIKVRAIAARHPGAWCMADDSGLEVRSLGGAPGVRSARYAGEPSNTPANNALLLKNLAGKDDRTANFTCAIALVDPEGREHEVEGRCFGRIAESPSGAEGFGYDPLFVPDGHDKSFAELSADEKNAISHRGRALEKVLECINGWHETRDERRDDLTSLTSNVPRQESRKKSILAWLRLFRVVNLPTVPGDVLVGAASAAILLPPDFSMWRVAGASLAGVFLYMYGLVDNDIVGAKSDRERPIPDGRISIRAARIARLHCFMGTMFSGLAFGLYPLWWLFAFALLASILLYNRTKMSLFMGACRGLSVLCGYGAAALPLIGHRHGFEALLAPAVLACAWTFYIVAVTWYSKGEEDDPEKKRRVGCLVGGIVYLQLIALLALALMFPQAAELRPLLVAGAVLLVVLRIFRHLFPRVSAS